MKRVDWLGDSRRNVLEFPEAVRQQAGKELMRVQFGFDPTDWKPMTDIGAGVKEIRVRDEAGVFRVIYVAKFEDAVYVLHVFQKKTQRTTRGNIELATSRYKALVRERGAK